MTAEVFDLILKNQEKQGDEIRQIRETLVRLARIEERHTAHRDTLERYGKWLNKHEQRIDAHDRLLAGNSKSVNLFDKIIERSIMLLVGAAIGALIIMKLTGG